MGVVVVVVVDEVVSGVGVVVVVVVVVVDEVVSGVGVVVVVVVVGVGVVVVVVEVVVVEEVVAGVGVVVGVGAFVVVVVVVGFGVVGQSQNLITFCNQFNKSKLVVGGRTLVLALSIVKLMNGSRDKAAF